MTQPFQEGDLERLFEVDEGLPCPLGTELLLVFAETYPADFTFLKPQDLVIRCTKGIKMSVSLAAFFAR